MDHYNGKEILTKTLVWLLSAIASAALMLLIFAILLYFTGLSEQHLDLYGLISCGIGSVLAGIGGGATMKQRGLIWGCIFGILYLFCLYIMFESILGSGCGTQLLSLKMIPIVGISAVSGTFSVNLRKE